MGRASKRRARESGKAETRAVMRGRRAMVLTARETEALLAALANPPVPNERLRAAAREDWAAVDSHELG